MGGTFDHFHNGHQHFIRFAASLAPSLKIGITTDVFLTQHPPKLFAKTIQPYAERVAAVRDFCRREQINAQLFPLRNPVGPQHTISSLDCLVVTPASQGGAALVNAARATWGYSTLPVHTCTLMRDSTNKVIASTRIRGGELLPDGTVLQSLLATHADRVATESQRQSWQQPWGVMVRTPTRTTGKRWVVGDVALDTFLQNSWRHAFGVFDGQTARHPYSSPRLQRLRISANIINPAGQITSALIDNLTRIVELRRVAEQATPQSKEREIFPAYIRVSGEEDLAAIVLTMVVPLGDVIYFGEAGGLRELVVTAAVKASCAKTLAT